LLNRFLGDVTNLVAGSRLPLCKPQKLPGSALLLETLCTTDYLHSIIQPDFVEPFSFCSQIAVFQVFYLYEQKMNSVVAMVKQP
jgi:hypothetical protein